MSDARRPLPWLAYAVLAGCAAAPELPDPVGVPTEVELLEGGFVRFEGRRIAVEFFLLEMRQRVRAARGDPAALPRVNLLVPLDAGADDGRAVSELREELHKAGVRFLAVAFAAEGA